MIILDFETNSTNPKDVLEVGAYRIVREDNKYIVVDIFHRYYFSKYEVNYFALDVHNLSPDKIEKLRDGVKYPKYFEDDKDFIEFCKGTTVLVAHNVSFELRYLDNLIAFKNSFCTMKENKNIVNAKNIRGNIKNPKLVETCEYYNIKFDYSQYHSALYDAEKALEILNVMNDLENKFDIVNYRLEEQKQAIKEKELIKADKIKQKYIKQLNIEKRKIEKVESLNDRECPKCNSNNIHKKGKRQRKDYQVQRYQCMDCQSIFQERIKEVNHKSSSLFLNEIEKIAKENLLKKAVKKRDMKIQKQNEKEFNSHDEVRDKKLANKFTKEVLRDSKFETKHNTKIQKNLSNHPKEKSSFIKTIFGFFS